MLKKTIFSIAVSMLAFFAGCQSPTDDAYTLTVGTISGPETQLMEVAQDVAKKCYGLKIKIVTFSDYNIPNVALHDGSIDANMFQHFPYLQAQDRAQGFRIVSAGKTFVYPMGIYSKTVANLQSIPTNAKIAVPNDPSNLARALLLLQKADLITIKSQTSAFATVADIQKNPKNLVIVPLAAAQLPRALSDVTAAVINTNYAIPAGLLLSQALFMEGPDSPYANIVAMRTDDVNNPKIKELMAALHSRQALEAASRIFGSGAIPAWNLQEPILPCTVTKHDKS
ncbi:MAG: hypothetical protein A3F10_05370 [Coxiella sp. RIFCSPHIGHO2_12_FULL_42_15]|nr:MAG: hypothetical protein A3F10_05370 [Coxiella sp. RIFCSPHIGHO2_12_FULL_42_15]